MLKTYFAAVLVSALLSLLTGFLVIPFLKRLKAGQQILNYVKEHKQKSGTPTMGGLFFIFAAVIVFLIFFKQFSRLAFVSIAIGAAYMIVGFLDDFIKIKFKNNKGLSAYQKIIFQIIIAAIGGIYAYVNGLTYLVIPFFNISVNLNLFIVPFAVFVFIATTNSVNLTDGIDGLAGSVSLVFFIFLAVIINTQSQAFNNALNAGEYENLALLCCCLSGALLGFLFFNANKASVFMGDTGSLALGGFISAVCILSGNSLFILIIGIMFVISSISVIIQVFYFKKTGGKRIFLMSPLHHHFQQKGHTEAKIVFVYTFITFLLGMLCIIF